MQSHRLLCCPLLVEVENDKTGIAVPRRPGVPRKDGKKDADPKFSFVLKTLSQL